MTHYNAIATQGGTADVISYPIEQDHPIDNPQDIEEAIAYANEAIDAITSLDYTQVPDGVGDNLASRLLNVAVENYITKFNIPAAALESNDIVPYVGPAGDDAKPEIESGAPRENPDKQGKQASRIKKVVKYLYAVVARIFNAIFDFLRNQKIAARKIMPKTKEYIGRADGLSSSVASQLNIKDRSLMIALHIDGAPPRKITEMFEELSQTFERQHNYSAVNEVIHLVQAVKEKNPARITKEAKVLHDKLEEGLKAALSVVDPSEVSVFGEKKAEGNDYYMSDPLFGQNYIYGVIGDKIADSGSFVFRCGIRRDAEVPLRSAFFPVLAPDDIRHICRTSLRISENIIRFSRDEELLQKALREASFLTTKEPDQSAVAALRNIAAVGQNSYIVYLRYVTRTMQSLMRWCLLSIEKYEEVGKP